MESKRKKYRMYLKPMEGLHLRIRPEIVAELEDMAKKKI